MTDTMKAALWLVRKPDEFVNGMNDLITIGFDLDRNTARDLIIATAIYKGIIEE